MILTTYTVYKMVHVLTNDVVYVGYTSRSLNERMREHRCKSNKSPAYDWITSVGKSNVSLVPICIASNKKEALEKEMYWTNELSKKYKLFNRYIGTKHNQEQIDFMIEWYKNHKHPCSGKSFHTKKVRCITTGQIFNSVTEANNYYKVCHISDVCNGPRTYCGKLVDGTKLEWEFVGKEE